MAWDRIEIPSSYFWARSTHILGLFWIVPRDADGLSLRCLYLTPSASRHEVLGSSIALTLFGTFCQSSELRTRLPQLIPLSSPKGRFFLCTALNTCTFSRPEFEDWQKGPKESLSRNKASYPLLSLHPKTSCRLGVR